MIQQGTEEWKKLRLGKVTASRVADVVARTKNGWSASRANYAAQLIAERLTGVAADSFSNAAMQHGTVTEPQARDAYSFIQGCDVEEVAFVDHPSIAMSGASPDGLVGDNGMVEIKCPNTATHLDTLLGAEIDGKYVKQMQWQMACTGRQWCDFVSFDPRLPIRLQLNVRRVNRDQGLIDTLETEIGEFLKDIDAKVTKLTKMTEVA